MVIMFIGFFLLFNFRVFVAAPTITIYDFEDTDIIVVEDSTYTINGLAKGSKNLYINDREILLNTDATFSEKLYLSKYQNIFSIKSVSKTGPIFNREVQIYRK